MLKVIWVSPQCFLTGMSVAVSFLLHIPPWHTPCPWTSAGFHTSLLGDPEVTTLCLLTKITSLLWRFTVIMRARKVGSLWLWGDRFLLELYSRTSTISAVIWMASPSSRERKVQVCVSPSWNSGRILSFSSCNLGLREIQLNLFSWLLNSLNILDLKSLS